MPVRHLKVSAKADGPDAGNVHASDWNAVHDLSGLVAGDITDLAEVIDDRVAALLVAGTNVTLTYNDTANTLTITAAGGGGSGGGNTTTVSDTAPVAPVHGDRWIKPSNMTEMVWVPNAGTPGVWINPADAAVAAAISYPIAVAQGGTGATDAPTALTNLGAVAKAGDTMTGTLKGATNLVFQPGTGGNIQLDGGRGAALTTSTTSGFVTSPTCAGTPVGLPVNIPTGSVASVFDSVGRKLWFNMPSTGSGVLNIAGVTTSINTGTSAVPAGAVAGDLLILILLDGSTGTIPMSTGFTALSTAGINAGSIGWRTMQAGDTGFPTIGGVRYSTMVAIHGSTGAPSIDQFASLLYTAGGTFTTPSATSSADGDISLMVFTSGQGVFSATLPVPPYTALIDQTANGVGTCGMVVTSTTLALAGAFSGCSVTGLAGATHNAAAFHVLIKSTTGGTGGWVSGTAGITDAPNDANTYGRNALAWVPITKTTVGLSNVDNTTDANKPVSTAQAAADALRVLKAGDTMTGALLHPDGTVAAPAIAFSGETGLGWYRHSAGLMATAMGGTLTSYLNASSPTGTSFSLTPRATGDAVIFLGNQPNGAANANTLQVVQLASGAARIGTQVAGSATRGNLQLDAPQVYFNDGTAAAPGLAWSSEPGLGWFRAGASAIRMAAQGGQFADFSIVSTTASNMSLGTVAAGGSSTFTLGNGPFGGANRNLVNFVQASNGSASIQTVATGSATRGNLTLDAPSVFATGGALQVTSSTGGAFLLLDGNAAFGKDIYGKTGGVDRWTMRLGGGTPANDDFQLYKYNDAGGAQTLALWIVRNTGDVRLPVGTLTIGNDQAPVYGNINLISNAASGKDIISLNGNVRKWLMRMGAGTGGGGDDFMWIGYQDNGATPAGNMSLGRTTGNLYINGTYSPVSDERTKHDIAPIAADTDAFMRIVPISFKRNHDPESGDHWGFSVQNLSTAYPQVVLGDVTATKTDGTPDPAGYDLVAVLAQTVLMVQTLNDRLTALEQA